MIEIIKQGIVASRPKQMYAWPGITIAANGDIIIAASERKFHCCPYGREVIIRSKDNGESWSLPQEVYNSELDDRDANLLTLPDGTMILTFFSSAAFTESQYILPEWEKRSKRITQKLIDEVAGYWLLRSFDGGYTWEKEPHRMPFGAHAGPTALSDGSLIYLGDSNGRMFGAKSTDNGVSWKVLGEISYTKPEGDCSFNLNENHVLEISPGKLVALFRAGSNVEENNQWTWQATSNDNGLTWSMPQKTLFGVPPHLLRLKSGAVLCSYSHRKEPFSIRAVLSYDECKSWDIENIITLYQWTDWPDMGYPVSVEINPNEILTVFYCSRKKRPFLKENEEYLLKDSTPEGLLYIKYILE